ncbi:Hypothetical predicted protein [Cloeon dipterum]|uniref:Uncharacterized protein n=1 Tax=Cloeon dipterum TaxID=197152 RepID=A0A8S1CKA4_9INSE|nr:Hypothetical predicted protein [Cloeon dipterum]
MYSLCLQSTFDLSQELYRNKEYILIISDIDGEQRELSRFLRNERNPFTEPNNRFRLSTFKTDNETGILIIDLPLFNEFKNNIVVDISNAFTLKLILSLADRLKIVLVMPDDIRGDSNAVKKFLLGLMKLVETLDENYISFLDSTMVVGTMTPKNNTNPEETKEDQSLGVKMMLLMLVLSQLALIACAPFESSQEFLDWNKIGLNMKKAYDYVDQQMYGNSEFILILGDKQNSERRSELSRFLRDYHVPIFEKTPLNFPRFDVDFETGALLIDVPVFDELSDLTMVNILRAFVNKLILDRAKRLKIVIVVPNDIDKKDTTRFSSLLTTLVKILDQNFEYFLDSIGVVSMMQPGSTENETKEWLHDLTSSVQNEFEYIQYKLFIPFFNREPATDIKVQNYELFYRRNLILSHVFLNDAFEVYNHLSKNLSYSHPVKKERYQVAVDYYMEQKIFSSGFFNNTNAVKGLCDRIVTAVLQTDFLKGNLDHIKKLESMDHPSESMVTSEISRKAEERWLRLRFELEILDFSQKILQRRSSLAEFNVQNLLVEQVKLVRERTLQMYTPMDSKDAEDIE